MTLDNFTTFTVATRLGAVRFWSKPDAPDPARPVVLVLPGMLTDFETPLSILHNVQILADGYLLELPNTDGRALESCRIEELSQLVGELIESHFGERRVVAVGLSTGAVIALGVRARNLSRIVAVEPYLATGDLWPVMEPLRERLRSGSLDATGTRFVWEAFGVSRDRSEARSYRALLDGRAAPVDVVLGDVPLQPRRDLPRFPSFVDEADRRWLAALPGVRLHQVASGHNALGQDSQAVMNVICEAARRAGATQGPGRLRVDEPLLDATPVAADRVLYVGAAGDDFADALLRRNPRQMVGLGLSQATAGPPFDVAVLDGPISDDDLAAAARSVRPGGWLVARWGRPDAALIARLDRVGFLLGEPVDPAGTGIIRAQRRAGEPASPTIAVSMLALAEMMMDIRTRLPHRGLATDAGMTALYARSSAVLPPLPLDHPKVVVLQRPREMTLEAWRRIRSITARRGWLTVLEFDDYPPLIDEVLGRPINNEVMRAFGYADAVQTSTQVLEDLFRPFNPEIAVFPNAAFDLPPFPAGPRPRRVFYGAMIRGAYAVKVAKSLGAAIQRCPDTEFVVIGDRQVFDALPTGLKEYHEYMGFESYLELMASCAVSLTPIEALPFRDTKSDAKYVDASRAGVLTIASPTIYDRVIRHGVNGLLALAIEDWSPLLIQALTDEAARERMARAAWEDVRDNRMFAYQVVSRRDWYLDLWARRKALWAALHARAPELGGV